MPPCGAPPNLQFLPTVSHRSRSTDTGRRRLTRRIPFDLQLAERCLRLELEKKRALLPQRKSESAKNDGTE